MMPPHSLTRDLDQLRQWIGRTRTVTQVIDARPMRMMQATLDREPDAQTGDAVPPFAHYLYFNDEVPASRLKEDGHEQLGHFLPPVDLPRRMWAGGRVEIDAPIRIGETATKTSTVEDVAMKGGRSGALCFVTVAHRFTVDEEHRFTETQDIVYREMPAEGATPPPGKAAPSEHNAHRLVTTDPVMLFRYSALIFYGHRIHYDIDYTRDVEGYPGLVVHGPLTVSLLTDMLVASCPDATLRSFDIRAHNPIFCGDPIHLELRHEGDTTSSWARTEDGILSMAVNARFDMPSQKERSQ